MEKMRAVVQREYGTPDDLEEVSVDVPDPGHSEVLIQVFAAGLNAADTFFLRGVPYLVRPMAGGFRSPRKDLIIGADLAGKVVATGKKATGFKPGDQVYAEARSAVAQFVCVSESDVAAMPKNLSFEQAAAMPMAANTALQGLRDVANVQAGQLVLINGASGGVGTFAVQIAASRGAIVIGVCSTANVDLVRSLGAARVIDYTQEDFTELPDKYDIILDLVGNHALPSIRPVLASRGILVLSAARGGKWLGPTRRIMAAVSSSIFSSQKMRPLVAKRSKENLNFLRGLAETGAITPVIDQVYPMAKARQAMEHVVEGHTKGKVIIAIDSPAAS